MFSYPEKFRLRGKNPMASHDGEPGVFIVRIEYECQAICVASNGFGWEHVSVHVRESGATRTPKWDEMCIIKSLFWGEEDCVAQYHPPKSNYINNMPHCLHLWRPIDKEIPLPPTFLVGVK